MKRLKVILTVVVSLVAVFVLGGFIIPAEYDVERSIVIEAPADQIFEPVSNLQQWPGWTVWNPTRYPGLNYEYEGPMSGVGSKSSWDHPETGKGRMEITKASASAGIEYTLNFEGFEPSYGRLVLSESEGVTKVTMGMKGSMGNNPIARYMGLMMDDWVGADYERGLARLRETVES